MWAISCQGDTINKRSNNFLYFWCCFSFRLLFIIEYIKGQCYIVLYLVRAKMKGFVNLEGTTVEGFSLQNSCQIKPGFSKVNLSFPATDIFSSIPVKSKKSTLYDNAVKELGHAIFRQFQH